MIALFRQPWPWWVSGPLIGLMVPLLLLLGNRPFGISSSMRHICAACFPANIPYFKYDWKKEMWNVFFAGGILTGAFIAWNWLSVHQQVMHPKLVAELGRYGIRDHSQEIPVDVINWKALLTLKGFLLIVMGGFFTGFGTRYVLTAALPAMPLPACLISNGLLWWPPAVLWLPDL